LNSNLRNPGLWLLIAAAFVLTGCETIRPVRTLPHWVRGVYIPMVENLTTEPGLEEVATQLTQEEFLADGRVRVVQRRDADLIVKVRILEYRVTVDDFDTDEVAGRSLITMLSDVRLFDMVDPDRPLANLGLIETESTYNSDPRATRYVVKPDANREALERLARQVVDRTITGFPVGLRDTPEGIDLPAQPDFDRIDEDSSRSRFPFP
jgi:hypothetical protein